MSFRIDQTSPHTLHANSEFVDLSIDKTLSSQGYNLQLKVISQDHIHVRGTYIDWNQLEIFTKITKLTLTIFSPNRTFDFNPLSKHITHLKFSPCRFYAESLSTLPNHLEELVFESVRIHSIGVDRYTTGLRGCIRKAIDQALGDWIISPPRIHHLTSLRHIQFIKCDINNLDWLPDQLETLHLEECYLSYNIKEERSFLIEKFSLKSLGKIKKVTFDKCISAPLIEFSLTDNRIKSLRILNHTPRLIDDNIKNFPQTLENFEIKAADITDSTIEKMDEQLRSLKLEDCPNVTMNLGRGKLLFPMCQIEGLKKETHKADAFRKKLEEVVIGQPQAIHAAFDALCISISGLTPLDKPSGIFLFVGPSGVGKTELANTTAAVGGKTLLRYDMGEYQLEHEVSKLIGSPPGYVGYDAGGKLINDVRNNPDAVVLFDEIEKANSTIHKVLLGVFDAGRLTDNKGTTTNFSRTIIIMTSNVGANQIASLDWNNIESALKTSEVIVKDLLKVKIAPEFVGRIHTVVPFRPLTDESVKNIMKSKVQSYEKTSREKDQLKLEICESVWRPLLLSLDPALGVRPAVNQFEQEVNSELARALLNELVKKGDKLKVFRDGGKIKLQLLRK